MEESVGRLQLRLNTAVEGLKNHLNKTRDLPPRHSSHADESSELSQQKLSDAYHALQGVRAREEAYLAEISTLRVDLDTLRESYAKKQGVIDMLRHSIDSGAHGLRDRSRKELVTRTDELDDKLNRLHDEMIKTQEHNVKILNEKDLRISELKAAVKTLELSLHLRDERIKDLTTPKRLPVVIHHSQLPQIRISQLQPLQFAPLASITIPESPIQSSRTQPRLIEEVPKLEPPTHQKSHSRRLHFSWPPASFA